MKTLSLRHAIRPDIFGGNFSKSSSYPLLLLNPKDTIKIFFFLLLPKSSLFFFFPSPSMSSSLLDIVAIWPQTYGPYLLKNITMDKGLYVLTTQQHQHHHGETVRRTKLIQFDKICHTFLNQAYENDDWGNFFLYFQIKPHTRRGKKKRMIKKKSPSSSSSNGIYTIIIISTEKKKYIFINGRRLK